MARIQILNGPNVNLIGTHHQNLFGSTTHLLGKIRNYYCKWRAIVGILEEAR